MKIFVDNKVELAKSSNLLAKKLIQFFRTYDNLASYEPGNMEYRGRAYSTEVGDILLCTFLARIHQVDLSVRDTGSLLV